MNKSKGTSSLRGILYGSYFLAFFIFLLLLSIGTRSTLAKVKGGLQFSGSWSHFYTMPIVIRILCEKINNLKTSLQIQELKMYPLSLTGYFSRVQQQCLLDFFVFFYVKVASQLSLVLIQQPRRLCQL